MQSYTVRIAVAGDVNESFTIEPTATNAMVAQKIALSAVRDKIVAQLDHFISLQDLNDLITDINVTPKQ